MKTKVAVLMTVCVLAAALSGCGSKEQVRVGFLSDYSKLQVESKTELRFVNKEALADYNKIIIAPIQTVLYTDVKVSDEDLATLRQYFYKAIYEAIEANDKVVMRPGPGVAKLRIALTNLKESNVALNVIPHTKLAGLGRGTASMEAELVDSITGEQIAAVVQSRKGNPLSLDGYSKWSDVKVAIDKWAKSAEKYLLEAH